MRRMMIGLALAIAGTCVLAAADSKAYDLPFRDLSAQANRDMRTADGTAY
jgi:hypothetical protein